MNIPLTTDEPCELHKVHKPRSHVQERHHIIPQAWQAFWFPDSHTASVERVHRFPSDEIGPARIVEGVRIPKPGLWHPDTITLCPTGHRNVHWWLVVLMRELSTQTSADVAQAARAVREVHIGRQPPEVALAIEGMALFRDAGGDLLALTRAKLWGQS